LPGEPAPTRRQAAAKRAPAVVVACRWLGAFAAADAAAAAADGKAITLGKKKDGTPAAFAVARAVVCLAATAAKAVVCAAAATSVSAARRAASDGTAAPNAPSLEAGERGALAAANGACALAISAAAASAAAAAAAFASATSWLRRAWANCTAACSAASAAARRAARLPAVETTS
jgi:hypothetical protein